MVRCGHARAHTTDKKTSQENRTWFHRALELFHVVALLLMYATCTAIASNGNRAKKAEACNECYTNAGGEVLKNH